MVLHPLDNDGGSSAPTSSISVPVPAWQAVERKQKQSSHGWLLIAQVDHSQLAGDLAARLKSPVIPPLAPDVIQAIAVHDAGWAPFDNAGMTAKRDIHPKLNDDGRPLSFLDVRPPDFVVAWNGSIAEAEKVSPAGGFIVSRHFSRLAEGRLNSRIDDEEDTSRLREFLHTERARQSRLSSITSATPTELEDLTDILQFCDLLSLYLCCGAADPVEFPQAFHEVHVRVSRQADMFHFDPVLFGSGVSLGICGRSYGLSAGSGSLAFLLQ